MLSQLAAVVIGLAAVATALGVLSRLRPVRWLGRTLVADPVTDAFRREVTDVVRAEVPAAVRAELAKHPITNGWGVKAVTAIADATGAEVPPLHHPPEGIDPEAPTEEGDIA